MFIIVGWILIWFVLFFGKKHSLEQVQLLFVEILGCSWVGISDIINNFILSAE